MLSTIFKLVITSVIVITSQSCNVNFGNGVKGKGPITTETYTLDGTFEKLSAKNGWEVELKKSNENKIEITTHENLQKLFTHQLDGKQLSIDAKNNIGYAEKKLVVVYYTDIITSLKTSSGTSLSAADVFEQKNLSIDASSGSKTELKLKTKNLSLDCSSGATIEVEGTSINLTADVSSGGTIEADELQTKMATVDASSGGKLAFYVEEKLTASTSSGGNVEYSGNPKEVSANESVSGGNIRKK